MQPREVGKIFLVVAFFCITLTSCYCPSLVTEKGPRSADEGCSQQQQPVDGTRQALGVEGRNDRWGGEDQDKQ